MYKIETTTTGKPQFIVNQDRNSIFPMYLENLHSKIIEKDGILYGINLMMQIEQETVILGSFDTVEEVIHEINELYNTDLEIYCITGYSPSLHLQTN